MAKLLRPRSIAEMQRRYRFGHWYFRPMFFGSDQLDLSRPALFVGNHTLYGVLDVPYILQHLYIKNNGKSVRSLGDQAHFSVPIWRDALQANGMVLGDPKVCDGLMEAGESVLVFPGGAREVMKRRDEKQMLVWKQRLGFVRIAIKHGYDIIPFASLGPDECYDILLDADDIQHSPLAQKVIKTFHLEKTLRGGDVIAPLSRGLGPTLIPRPQRFYASFGERIPTAGLSADNDTLWAIREQVAASIYRQLDEMNAYRTEDRKSWSWLRRQLT